MAGINTTGKANTSDYVLGRGKVFFANLNADGTPDTYRFLGNCPEFTTNVAVETLEHQSSQEGLKKTDKEVVTSQTINLTLTLDELNFDNIALFFSGEATSESNADDSSFADILLSGAVTLGRWYDIRDANGVRLYDISDSGDLTFGTTTGTPDLVEGTDYELDLVMGRVFLLSTATNIQDGDDLYCNYTAGSPSTVATLSQVEALTQTSITGALKFILINPTDADHQTEMQFHSVSLKGEGDFSLIGDDWTTMQLSGKAEASSGTHASVTGKSLTIRTHADA